MVNEGEDGPEEQHSACVGETMQLAGDDVEDHVAHQERNEQQRTSYIHGREGYEILSRTDHMIGIPSQQNRSIPPRG